MFRVLSDIHLDLGSVRIIPITRNTTKQDPFGIYVGFGSVRIHFYQIGFGSGYRVRFICPALLSPIDLGGGNLAFTDFFLPGNMEVLYEPISSVGGQTVRPSKSVSHRFLIVNGLNIFIYIYIFLDIKF